MSLDLKIGSGEKLIFMGSGEAALSGGFPDPGDC
jgi:hypothetical protein